MFAAADTDTHTELHVTTCNTRPARAELGTGTYESSLDLGARRVLQQPLAQRDVEALEVERHLLVRLRVAQGQRRVLHPPPTLARLERLLRVVLLQRSRCTNVVEVTNARKYREAHAQHTRHADQHRTEAGTTSRMRERERTARQRTRVTTTHTSSRSAAGMRSRVKPRARSRSASSASAAARASCDMAPYCRSSRSRASKRSKCGFARYSLHTQSAARQRTRVHDRSAGRCHNFGGTPSRRTSPARATARHGTTRTPADR
jgi:hypothetical protein